MATTPKAASVLPQSVMGPLTESGFASFKTALEIAFERGGLNAVVDVCRDLVDGAEEDPHNSGLFATKDWCMLASLEKRFPGSTANFTKYYPKEQVV